MFIISISALLLHACGLITHLCVLLGALALENEFSLELDRAGLGYHMSGHEVQ